MPLFAGAADFGRIGDRRAACAQIILNALPVPSDNTPWEQIIDFRADPDTRRTLLSLRNWFLDVVRGSLTPVEREQKLDWLLSEYMHYMKIYRMDSKSGVFETIITTSAEILDNLVRAQVGNAVKAVFKIRRKGLHLLKAEMHAPGRELAYVDRPQKQFG